MSISFVGVANSEGQSSNFAFTVPTGLAVGDVLIASMISKSTGAVITPPSGWTLIASVTFGSSKYNAYWKVATSAEVAGGSALNFTQNVTVNRLGHLYAYRGAHSVTPVKTKNWAVGQGTPVTLPAITPTAPKGRVLLLAGADSDTSLNPPAGFTQNYLGSYLGTYSLAGALANTDYPNTASTGNYSIPTFLTANVYQVGVTVYLEPPNNTPTLTLTNPANNQVLAEGSTYTLAGSVADSDIGNALSVKYSIGGGPTQSFAIGTSDGVNPVSFSKTLTYSNGRFWDGSTDVSGLLQTEAASISIWTNDGIDDSAVQTRNFTITQQDGGINIPVNVVSSAYLVSQMARPVRLNNGWLVGSLLDTTGQKQNLYVSKDNGRTWVLLCYQSGITATAVSLVSKGNFVYTMLSGGTSGAWVYRVNAATVLSTYDFKNDYVTADSGQTTTGTNSLAITPDGNNLWWAASTKNTTYANSYNIRAAKIPINADGTLGTPGAVEQVTTSNTTAQNLGSPSIVIKDGNPVILTVFSENSGATQTLVALGKTSAFTDNWWNAWKHKTVLASSYAQANPHSVVGVNGKVCVTWHGKDATDTTNDFVRFNVALDGAAWGTAKKLVKGQNASITSDKNGKLSITYEDAGTIKRIESTDEFATFTTSTVGTGTKPAALYDPTFTFDFVIPPTIFQVSNAVKYYGSYNTNTAPILSLSTPASDQVLSEAVGSNIMQVSGTRTDSDVGNVTYVKIKVDNGPTSTIDSDVSSGSAIPFNENLTYANKRLMWGQTDVVGVDLTENATHVLHLWAEDDKGGVSAEQTRNFTVIWNRAPVIDGVDSDLGTINTIPAQSYTVDDLEGDTFTIDEYLNGELIRTLSGTGGTQYTITIDQGKWLRLPLEVQNTLKVRATDSKGAYSERIFTFTRTETQISFVLDYDNPDVVADFGTLDAKPFRVLVTLDATFPEGSTFTVEACNNYYDTVPTWEDLTNAVKAKRGYVFTNATKTAADWAVNIRVTADKGTATEKVIIRGFGGAFD